MSVAGLLMMLLGTVYTLIGIKNRRYGYFQSLQKSQRLTVNRVHIFLSTAFLTSLTVTVYMILVLAIIRLETHGRIGTRDICHEPPSQ